MFAVFQRFLDWLRSLFWKEELELTLVGLQYSGKTTFVSVIAVGYEYLHKKYKFPLICFPSLLDWPILGGHDSNGGLQHAQSDQGQCEHQDLGHWWPATVQDNVGEVLSRSECHHVGCPPKKMLQKIVKSLTIFHLQVIWSMRPICPRLRPRETSCTACWPSHNWRGHPCSCWAIKRTCPMHWTRSN